MPVWLGRIKSRPRLINRPIRASTIVSADREDPVHQSWQQQAGLCGAASGAWRGLEPHNRVIFIQPSVYSEIDFKLTSCSDRSFGAPTPLQVSRVHPQSFAISRHYIFMYSVLLISTLPIRRDMMTHYSNRDRVLIWRSNQQGSRMISSAVTSKPSSSSCINNGSDRTIIYNCIEGWEVLLDELGPTLTLPCYCYPCPCVPALSFHTVVPRSEELLLPPLNR